MKCSVEGCDKESTEEPSGSDEFKLCQEHWSRWGDFRAGYYDGHYGNFERHGRLNRKLWRNAMLAFLDHCRVEIEACTMIAEGLVGEDILKAYTKTGQRSKGER